MLSNNPGLLALVVVFIAGALLFALGTFMVRREKQAPSPSVVVRIDQSERLALVGQPWCVEQLEREFLTDRAAEVRNAAEDALVVIRARGGS